MLCRPSLEANLTHVKVEEAPANFAAELESLSDVAPAAGGKGSLAGMTQVRPVTQAPLHGM